ncbi:hypothetical protein D3C77_478100 [compost metagenome]
MLDVGETVRCMDRTGLGIQRDAGTGNQVAIDTVCGGLKLRIRPAKSLAVPEVNACLILHLDIHPKVLKELLSRLDDLVLGLPGQVIVEIENVVILDAPSRWFVCLMIPHRLKQASGSEQALVQAQRRQAGNDFGVDRVGHGDADQPLDSQCHVWRPGWLSVGSGYATWLDAISVTPSTRPRLPPHRSCAFPSSLRMRAWLPLDPDC